MRRTDPKMSIHASLERPGSSDWAVLCSAAGNRLAAGLFRRAAPEQPIVLASAPETERLQAHDPSGVLGFNWGIDPASPEQVHEAQTGMRHRPPRLDHDALADSVVDHAHVYHFYLKSAWTCWRCRIDRQNAGPENHIDRPIAIPC